MAVRAAPGLGLSIGYADGVNGWGAAMNTSLRVLSVATQLSVKNLLLNIAALPASPANGDMYIILSGTNALSIAVRDEGAWVYISSRVGWRAYNEATGLYVYRTATAWTGEGNFLGRTLYISAADPTSGDGVDGDLWFKV